MKVGDKFVITGNGSPEDTEVLHYYEIGTVVECISPVICKYETNGVEVVNVSGTTDGFDLEQQVEPRHLKAIN